MVWNVVLSAVNSKLEIWGGQGVAGSGGPLDVRAPGQPLVAENHVVQSVPVGNTGCVCRQGLANLGRAVDGGHSGGCFRRWLPLGR